MNKILMVALDFAPCRSAGVQRTLRFSEYLRDLNWQANIITATENVYDRRDDTLRVRKEVADKVVKAKCLDVTKKYSVFGRYFEWMVLPDRFWPWYFDAVKQGSMVIEQDRPDVIWSTYPVLTAHLIAKKITTKIWDTLGCGF